MVNSMMDRLLERTRKELKKIRDLDWLSLMSGGKDSGGGAAPMTFEKFTTMKMGEKYSVCLYSL